MLSIYLENGCHEKLKISDIISPISGKQLQEKLKNEIGDHFNNFFIKNNGLPIYLDTIISNGDLILVPKLCGGKGGFGSMLRAIGAQIEKTTNREACRDLSGRRLRDINKEKRLKSWIEKQSERNEEAAEKKKKKLERLCAEPKHEFKDKSYDEKRSGLTERVGSAVDEGFAVASTSTVEKRKAEPEIENIQKKKKKKKTILDSDDDSDSDSESSDSEQSKSSCKRDSGSENISEGSSNDKKSNQSDEKSTDDTSR